MKRIALIAVTLAAGSLLGIVLAELALWLFGVPARNPVVRYTIQRNSPLFSPALDASSPLFYTYAGIRVEGDSLAIHYPDRGPRIVPLARPPGTFRIVAVGDSLTEQWDCPGYANYTSYLEELLLERSASPRFEVLPLGIGGYNTWQERHFFERYLNRLETDLLLLQYCANDGDVMSLRARKPGAMVPDNEWPSFEIVGERFGRPDFARGAIGPFHSRLLWLLRHGLGPSDALHGYSQVKGNEEQREALIWFRDRAAARKIPMLVVIFPLLDDGYAQPESRYIEALLTELGIDYLDAYPTLARHGPLARLARDLYHPTNEGHRHVARAILDRLEKKSLLPRR